jgi:hypothetical protein
MARSQPCLPIRAAAISARSSPTPRPWSRPACVCSPSTSAVTVLRAPFLFVGSRSDFRAPLREALAIFRAVGSHDKRTAFYPGYLHGWQLVQAAPYAARTRALIMAWIHARS